jgi:hypothetical protein
MTRELRDHFLAKLAKAQEQRSQRADWIEFERSVMFEAVNNERQARGLPPISLTDVMRVERMATGHVDYSSKFALYCAELVFVSVERIYP